MTPAISAWAANWAKAAPFTWLRSGRGVAAFGVPDVRCHHPIGKRAMVVAPSAEKFEERLGRFQIAAIHLGGQLPGPFSRGIVLEFVPFIVGGRGRTHE